MIEPVLYRKLKCYSILNKKETSFPSNSNRRGIRCMILKSAKIGEKMKINIELVNSWWGCDLPWK